jgi:glycosyltransferase involved in cell wall biosynthesis
MIQPDKAEILYVAHDTGLIGGAERQLLELFRGIDRDRFSPHLICLEEGGPVAERAGELGVPVSHVIRRWRWDLGAIVRIRAYIRAHRISIVHAYLGLPGFYSAMAGRASGIKVITTIRIAGPRRRVADVTERLAFLVSDRIVSNSRAGVDYYFRHFPGKSKTVVIYNGYKMSDFEPDRRKSRAELGLPESNTLIGHVANLSYLKDYPTFIKALAAVFGEEPDARAVIVGEGDRRGRYEDLARSLGVHDRIVFLGHRHDVLDLVSQFDVCVLASHGDYSEGLSNSIAEYMGLGKPVVATAVGGNVELVQDAITGYLCPAGEPQPMAQRILTLLHSKDARASMGAEGRKFFEANLTLERMIDETQRVYDNLLVK